MKSELLLRQPDYNPDKLLDTLIDRFSLTSDAALSRLLSVDPPVISGIRHRKLAVGASMLLRMHEVSDLSVHELRSLMGTAHLESKKSQD